MLLKCKRISEPYFGPHSDIEITTYYLSDSQGIIYKWHSGPNKELKCEVGDIIEGIELRESNLETQKGRKIINYKKSNPVIVKLQDFLNI